MPSGCCPGIPGAPGVPAAGVSTRGARGCSAFIGVIGSASGVTLGVATSLAIEHPGVRRNAVRKWWEQEKSRRDFPPGFVAVVDGFVAQGPLTGPMRRPEQAASHL